MPRQLKSSEKSPSDSKSGPQSGSEDSPDGKSLSLFDLELELSQALEQWWEADQALQADGTGSVEAIGELNTLRAIVMEYVQAAADKRDRIARFMLHLQAQEETADKEIKRLQARKKRFSSARDRLSWYVQTIMLSQGVDKLEGVHSTFALRKNPESIEIVDERLVPERHKVDQQPVVSKKSVMEEYKMLDELRAKKLEREPGVEVPEPSVPGTLRHRDGKRLVIL